MPVTFNNSQRLLEKALKVIPNGTGTFSKSRSMFPVGSMPLYLDRGKGSHVWDVDGNEYIDMVSALCPVILGYCDEDVDNAVKKQMEKGVIFTLPSELEIAVAEQLCTAIPCAEMVRFGKNGSDATSGAVRLARYHTRRDLIATNGYHGWHDEFNGITGRNGGVPQAIRALTKEFQYNDINSLNRIFQANPGQVACVIMEPVTFDMPTYGFLEEVKEITHKNGAILIFDEVLTGFRIRWKGAQGEYGVIPDLACYGKAIANGYPLSAVVGSEKIMRDFENIHFSFTNSGECLSLAAAMATLTKLQTHDVYRFINARADKIFEWCDLNGVKVKGYHSRNLIVFDNENDKLVFMQECAKRGVLTIGVHNMMYAHTDEDINKLLSVYDEVFPIIKQTELEGKTIESNFRIR